MKYIYIYTSSGCFQSLQLVSNPSATWLLTTVPGSMEQHQPPMLRSNHQISSTAVLACNNPAVSVMTALCTFWTPKTII